MTDITMHSLARPSTASVLDRIASFFAAWGSARASAAALEFGRRPANDDLRRLGIDPQAFARIRLN